ncbi:PHYTOCYSTATIN 2 [Hibiscus trionum]|uniref:PHYTOCYSTATIN 2 n=1 Tax=Hibiscus trionum TaxID=183268 RepID=A0A9W7IGE1_HIBTR|nr:PHYTOCYSTATIN 2 [Hibiscus trionum]
MAKTKLTIFALLLVLAALFAIVEGREPVTDATADTGVQELGKFAVEEYNKKKQQKVEFSKVVQAAKQKDSGTKYFLRIEGSNKGEMKTFNAVVLVKPSDEKEMLSFFPRR